MSMVDSLNILYCIKIENLCLSEEGKILSFLLGGWHSRFLNWVFKRVELGTRFFSSVDYICSGRTRCFESDRKMTL